MIKNRAYVSEKLERAWNASLVKKMSFRVKKNKRKEVKLRKKYKKSKKKIKIEWKC